MDIATPPQPDGTTVLADAAPTPHDPPVIRREEVVEFLVEAELGVVLRSGVIGKHLIVIEPQRS